MSQPRQSRIPQSLPRRENSYLPRAPAQRRPYVPVTSSVRRSVAIASILDLVDQVSIAKQQGDWRKVQQLEDRIRILSNQVSPIH